MSINFKNNNKMDLKPNTSKNTAQCAIQSVTTSTFERTWHNANFPPKEGGRYWCVVEEQNDLGKSKFQWNCAWNPNDNRWSDDGETMNVTYYTELAPMPD